MSDHVVAADGEIDDGERLLVEIEEREIGVFRIDGEYYAYVNWCAHQSGPCCEGNVTGTVEASVDPDTKAVSLDYVREGRILNCPWHGWEYDIETGDCLSRRGVDLPSYPVRVEGGDVIVEL